jgi:hypothetical protein
MKTRAQVIAEAVRIRGEIAQLFSDTEHWNSINPDKEPVDPDPDGTLKRMAAGIDKGLKREDYAAVVEELAQAIWEAAPDCEQLPPWNTLTQTEKEEWRITARKVIETVKKLNA